MNNLYFVIYNSEGDTTVESITEKTLLSRLEEEYWGSDVKVLETIPENNDTNYWGDSILIVKGKIPTISSVEVITKFKVN